MLLARMRAGGRLAAHTAQVRRDLFTETASGGGSTGALDGESLMAALLSRLTEEATGRNAALDGAPGFSETITITTRWPDLPLAWPVPHEFRLCSP